MVHYIKAVALALLETTIVWLEACGMTVLDRVSHVFVGNHMQSRTPYNVSPSIVRYVNWHGFSTYGETPKHLNSDLAFEKQPSSLSPNSQ